MGIGKKMTKGMIGGGVNIAHKSKMSNAAKNQMGFSNGMPGPNVVGRGMAQYIAGENVSIGMRMGKPHGGPKKGKAHENTPYKLGDLSVDAGSGGMKKMDPMYNGIAGTQPDDFLQFDKSGGVNKSGGPAMPLGKGANVENKKETRLDKTKKKAKDAKEDANNKVKKLNKTQAEVDSMKISKAKADRLAKRQKRQEGRAERKTIRKNKDLSRGDKRKQIIDSREKQNKKGPSKTVELDNVTVTGDKNLVGANDTKVLKHLKKSGRDAKNIKEALKKYGKNRVYRSARSSGGDYALFQGQYGKQ